MILYNIIILDEISQGEFMQYFRTLFFLTLFTTFPIAINSMQPQQPIHEVVIRNETCDKIAVQYKLRNVNWLYTRILTPGATLRLDNFENLATLNITSYGKFKEWFSLNKLSFGYWGLRNLVEDIKEKIKEKPEKRYAILAVQGWRYFCSLMPYSFPVKLSTEAPVTRPILKLWDVFPRAKEAKKAKRKIEARYILGVPEGASREAITNAYGRLKAEWQPKIHSNRVGEAFFAHDVLNLIEAAYRSLMGGRVEQAEFDLEIAKELEARTMHGGDFD